MLMRVNSRCAHHPTRHCTRFSKLVMARDFWSKGLVLTSLTLVFEMLSGAQKTASIAHSHGDILETVFRWNV